MSHNSIVHLCVEKILPFFAYYNPKLCKFNKYIHTLHKKFGTIKIIYDMKVFNDTLWSED